MLNKKMISNKLLSGNHNVKYLVNTISNRLNTFENSFKFITNRRVQKR